MIPAQSSTLGRTVVALAAVALAAACAGGGPAGTDGTAGAGASAPDESPATELTLEAGSSVVGLPDGVGEQPAGATAGAGRTAEDGLIYVITFGSSTCPAVPDATATRAGPASVDVTFPEPGSGPCTADFVPATSVVALPDGVDAGQDLTVTVGADGVVLLPAGSDAVVWASADA